MRALIVDDSRTMRSILRLTLRSAGIEAIEAGDGVEALTVLEHNADVNFALVDWNMPRMNGLEFLCAARSNPAYAPVKFLMVTTETELAQVQSALEHGADEYLMKPFTREAVIAKLQLLGLLSQAL